MARTSRIAPLLLIALLSTLALHAKEFNDYKNQRMRTIAEQCLRAVPYEEEEWPHHDGYCDFLAFAQKQQENPQPHVKRRRSFDLLEAAMPRPDEHSQTHFDEATWQDLDLFYGKSDKNASLIARLDRTSTELGRTTLSYMLAHPTTDMHVLRGRQEIVQELISNKALRATLEHMLSYFKHFECTLLSFWGNDLFKNQSHRNYFQTPYLKRFNGSPFALGVKNVFDQQARLAALGTTACATTLLPLYGLSKITNITLPASLTKRIKKMYPWPLNQAMPFLPTAVTANAAASSALCLGGSIIAGLQIKDVWDWVQGSNVMERYLQTKMIRVASCLRALKKISSLIDRHPALKQNLKLNGHIAELFSPAADAALRQLIELLQTKTFRGAPSIFSHGGRILVAYKLMHDVKGDIARSLAALGELDAYLSIAKLYEECSDEEVTYSFAQYEEAATPSLALTNFWNPFIDRTTVVPNSIELGTATSRRNMIITGPNEGGKSTVLRSIAICTLLAQTIGIVPAQAMTLTPFKMITSYLNMADDLASGNSLYKAEVLRACELLKNIRALNQDESSIVFFDELFRGTGHVEGAAGAYGIAKHLAEPTNSIALIATHYPLLTSLEAETNAYTNYKVSVELLRSGSILHPYKLEYGRSFQNVAIQVLRNEGLDESILATAESVLHAPSVDF